MDFMKAFDQTVREIKREVNLKVLKVPEIEQKVLDATDDEPWGPHGTALAEIAEATKKFTECQMVMNVLWTRLTETGKNWRHVYKALAVIEYLVSHGSERSVDDIIEHTFQISSLASFEYVEPTGKDLGINVRKKAEKIVALLNNKDKIQEVRNKASANREKYFGLSSSGITYKSGTASFSSSSWKSSDRYGGFGNTKDDDTYQDSYNEKDKYGDDKFEKTAKSKKEPSHYGSKDQDSVASGASKTSTKTSKPDKHAAAATQSSSVASNDDEDFDPRGMSSAKTSARSNQADHFGQDLMSDLLDSPIPIPMAKSDLNNDTSEIDLFADADFVSATPQSEAGIAPEPQGNIDLFASQPAPSPAVTSTYDFFAAPDPAPQPDNNASNTDSTTNTVDPFAAVPLNNFDNSRPFGSLSSHIEPIPTASTEHSANDGSNANGNGTSVETKPLPKKDPFQVKSGIWADSLSRGIIDLNISAPKKINLADVGVVGGLTDGSEDKDKGPITSLYMGRAMGSGSGLGKSGVISTSTGGDDFFSSLGSQQYDFSSFRK
ncbi:Hypothetical predicted protein [Olea europaea subsp. europaea]|uniref:ENTH domain-containing protein n=2 Tax=Olea europaea subsp. europaea TaxID=158383 RepID=A0A8S0S467_OLEEU|nr:Hypothetical predicted protein [Olea europaea subsp. europaea]